MCSTGPLGKFWRRRVHRQGVFELEESEMAYRFREDLLPRVSGPFQHSHGV